MLITLRCSYTVVRNQVFLELNNEPSNAIKYSLISTNTVAIAVYGMISFVSLLLDIHAF